MKFAVDTHQTNERMNVMLSCLTVFTADGITCFTMLLQLRVRLVYSLIRNRLCLWVSFFFLMIAFSGLCCCCNGLGTSWEYCFYEATKLLEACPSSSQGKPDKLRCTLWQLKHTKDKQSRTCRFIKVTSQDKGAASYLVHQGRLTALSLCSCHITYMLSRDGNLKHFILF